MDISARRAQFRTLHESGCFVIPNPWDIGSAKYLELLGFKALATTSSGFAFTLGLSDEGLVADAVINHVAELVAATDIPVSADFQAGYADTAEGVAENVRQCAEAGAAGLSIEDATGDRENPLFELQEAVERISAAKEALAGSGVMLTGRAEGFIVGRPYLDDVLRRLRAYSEAGADVLFAPGVLKPEEIRQVVQAVAPKPVNVIMHVNVGLRVRDLEELGVRRISVGSALARAAWTGFINAAKPLAERGSFEGFEGLVPFQELNAVFGVG
jgi:2-methylisocitrate lyase-like PEP mutase family enzyme